MAIVTMPITKHIVTPPTFLACPAGFLVTAFNSTQWCVPCPAGWVCAGGGSAPPHPCVDGVSWSATGSSGCTPCSRCDSVMRNEYTFVDCAAGKDTVCRACPVGFHVNEEWINTTTTPCQLPDVDIRPQFFVGMFLLIVFELLLCSIAYRWDLLRTRNDKYAPIPMMV
jgi:hypothetical protein